MKVKTVFLNKISEAIGMKINFVPGKKCAVEI